jgi:hypothetical protein
MKIIKINLWNQGRAEYGQRKGPSGANAPPLHGIKKCLENLSSLLFKLSANKNLSTLFLKLSAK